MRNLVCMKIFSCLFLFCVLLPIICDGEAKFAKNTTTHTKHRNRCSKCFQGQGKCYKLCTAGKNIRHAAISCINHGATILNIELPGEVTFLSNLIAKKQPDQTKWHVGGKLIKGHWYWFSTTEKRSKQSEKTSSGGIKRKRSFRTIRKPIFNNLQGNFMLDYKKKCLTLNKLLDDTEQFVLTPDWCSNRNGISFICQQEELEIPGHTGTGVCGTKPLNTETSVGERNSSTGKITYKITGGRTIPRGEVPWQARIISFHPLWNTAVHEGGATIISEYWILTAAHCIAKVTFRSLLRIIVGDHDNTKWDFGEQLFEIAKIIIHPRYVHQQTMAYDIALIRVKPKNGRGIRFNQYVQPACLPTANTTLASGLYCTISGWGPDAFGASSAQHLKAAKVPLVPKSTCKRLIPLFSKRRMICAGFPIVQGVDTTNGDSGGPLICPVGGANVVAGVTAFGRWPFGYHPGGYTKVQAYLKWLYKTIKKNSKFYKQRKLPKRPKT